MASHLKVKGGLLAAIMATSFLGPFGGNMLLSMFRALRESYNVDILLLGLGITLYMIPYSLFQLFSGALSDAIYGRRKVMTLGFILYALGALGVMISPSIGFFLAFRVLQGLGNALTTPVAIALVGDIFPGEVRGRVMGLVAISITLGSTLGPLFGGAISTVNWRLGFVVTGIIALALGAFLYFLLEDGETKREGNLSGALILLRSSLLDPRILIISLMGLIAFFVQVGLFTYLSDLLSLPPYEYRSDVIGGYLSLSGFGGLSAGMLAGYLTDRAGRWITTLIGYAALTATLAAFTSDGWIYYLPMLLFLFGVSITTVSTALNTMIVEVAPERRATASSIYGSLRFLGYALAPALLYPIYQHTLQGVALVCTGLSFTTLLIGFMASTKLR